MDELDLLKKHWNANHNFPKVSKDEIRGMIHKKSSSIVMWIFIISVIEFLALNLASLFLFNEDSELKGKSSPVFEFIVNNIDYLSGLISLIFIVLFYIKYRKICVADNTKKLMKQILQTKKMVNYYIAINISIISILTLYAAISVLSGDNDPTHGWKYYLFIIGIFLLLFLIFFGIIWLYYRVVYGILIKRLMKNYQELEKIED
ncbi:hypothetical protein HX004_15185 [Myroides sp. 1354]|nr:hypothetical protein [Myroides sp. R163-1]MDM1057104.1 hypothetical protein [Myroides sp. 1354]MDM1070311.1 hypothetical protein [Myroides sp. 1372]